MEPQGSTASSLEPTTGIMVFRPTYEEFKDFNSYIQHIESLGAHKAGLAKIIPPREWVPRKNGYEINDIDMIIPAPGLQKVKGKDGLYKLTSVAMKSMTATEYSEMAQSMKYKAPTHSDTQDIEKLFWNQIMDNSSVYGSNVTGSLMDDGLMAWNINCLGSILDGAIDDNDVVGINTACLSFGMWKTILAWRLEEMDLYSINYLHFGASRTWYAIPPEHGRRFELLVNEILPDELKKCSAFLRHETTLVSPQVLMNHDIPFNKVTQEAGEIVITFPYGYHADFNHGFNCSEFTNFATPRWIEYGKGVSHCCCGRDSVKINMEIFVKRFQQERYTLLLEGKDEAVHPEDQSHVSIEDTQENGEPSNENNDNSNEELAYASRPLRRRKRQRQHPYDAAALQEVLNEAVESEAFQDNNDNNIPESFENFEPAPQQENIQAEAEPEIIENIDPENVLLLLVGDESSEHFQNSQMYLQNGVSMLEYFLISFWELNGGLPSNIHINHNPQGMVILYSENESENGENAM